MDDRVNQDEQDLILEVIPVSDVSLSAASGGHDGGCTGGSGDGGSQGGSSTSCK